MQVARRVGVAAREMIQRRHRPDYKIVLYMGLLMLLGLVIMYAIGPQRANVLNNAYGTDYYTDMYFFIKQTTSLLLALGAFLALAFVPFSWFKRHAKAVLIVGILACVVLMVAGNWLNLGIAQCSLGACRWFDLGPLGSLQPAELLKFGMLVFIAGFLGMRMQQGLINDLYKTIIPLGALVVLASLFIIGIQKDMGTGIALLAIVASMLIVAGLNIRTTVLLGVVGALLLGLMVLVAPHRMERIATFLAGDNSNVAVASDDEAYHITHAKIAIGSGGIFGVGIGNSVQATGYLPEAINDSVFAIMGETFGFVGLVVILLIFTALLLRVLRVADNLPDVWMKLVVAGIFGWLASHVILNVAAMIGVFPLTGITLPLLSFGGTSMVFIAGALGLVFQLSRYTVHGSVNKEDNYEDSRGRRGVWGPRYASGGRASRTKTSR
jgi:cell division protein FtsW